MRSSSISANKLLITLVVGILIFSAGCQTTRPLTLDEKDFNDNLSLLVKHPTHDVPGRDFRTIPRYPGSLRIVYQKKETEGKITYVCAYRTLSGLNEVSSFYETKMAKNGWLVKVKDEKMLTMIFIRRSGGLPLAEIIFRPADTSTIVNIIVETDK